MSAQRSACFKQTWRRGKSLWTLAGGLFFTLVALDGRFWGNAIEFGENDDGVVFWVLLFLGSAATLGSAAAFICPPLVLAADRLGVTFGGVPRFGASKIHVMWKNVRQVQHGTYVIGSGKARRRVTALLVECDAATDLKDCGNSGSFSICSAGETDVRFVAETGEVPSSDRPERSTRNIAVIDSSCFDTPVHYVAGQLNVLKLSAEE